MEIIEVLKIAFERGYFTFDDADAIDREMRLTKADWGSEAVGDFQRLEMEVTDDDPSDLKAQAQDIGLWVDYVSPPGMRTCLRFTIPPKE